MTDLGPDLAAEVAAVAQRYRLCLGPQRFAGRTGDLRGRGVGSSQEFFDFRDYVPGDDLRHLDWRGYARTEQLRIRLHQEEVAPHLDVLVDTSASMAVTAAKERAVKGLLGAITDWAGRQGVRPRVLALGGGPIDTAALDFSATTTAPVLPALPLRPAGVRVLLTDGLWPEGQTGFLQRLLVGAARCFVLQLLDPWELEPDAEGAMTLVDVETGDRREVQLDRQVIAGYRQRLLRLCDTLRGAVVARGATYARVRADALPAMCERDLLPAAVVEPA
ncbi:MAG: DUF58 domain-containing protein [Planctomycetes bacterium]|nr:DUF58 domain-containing protein [Planctomycetota bacterium]